MYVVFLNSKLISCDTILPLMMELHARTKRPVQFLLRDRESVDAIRLNRYLWDAIHAIGSIRHLQREDKSATGLVRHRLKVGWLLLVLALKARLGKVHFLHFRALNYYPLRLLFVANPRRTVFCESDSFGEPPLMAKVGSVGVNRGNQELPASGRLLAFSPHFRWLDHPALAQVPRHIFGPTRTRKIWLDYVRNRLEADWAGDFDRAGLPPPETTFVIMLGYFGYPGTIRNEPGLPEMLFAETLDALAELWPGLPIALKPHVFTDMEIVHRQLRKRPDVKAVVTYLHPTALALKARAVITNLYSTTQADAKMLGVPTIEYTEYSDEALALSGGESMRPDMIDHFIQRDPQRLRAVLGALTDRTGSSRYAGALNDPSGALDALNR